MKHLLSFLVAVTAFIVTAQELVVTKDLTSFLRHSQLSYKGGVFTLKTGAGTVFTHKLVEIDPTKKYKISADIKATGKNPTIYIGYLPMNEKKQQISCISVNDKAKTLTTVAKTAKKGDKVLYLTNCDSWYNNRPYVFIAFNATEDFSDMPNNDTLPMVKNSIVKKDNVWEVKLEKPLTKNIVAGTLVRQHIASSAFIYPKLCKVTAEWNSFAGITQGIVKRGISNVKFWPKTKYVRPLILVTGGDKTTIVEFKNFKMELVK